MNKTAMINKMFGKHDEKKGLHNTVMIFILATFRVSTVGRVEDSNDNDSIQLKDRLLAYTEVNIEKSTEWRANNRLRLNGTGGQVRSL